MNCTGCGRSLKIKIEEENRMFSVDHPVVRNALACVSDETVPKVDRTKSQGNISVVPGSCTQKKRQDFTHDNTKPLAQHDTEIVSAQPRLTKHHHVNRRQLYGGMESANEWKAKTEQDDNKDLGAKVSSKRNRRRLTREIKKSDLPGIKKVDTLLRLRSDHLKTKSTQEISNEKEGARAVDQRLIRPLECIEESGQPGFDEAGE